MMSLRVSLRGWLCDCACTFHFLVDRWLSMWCVSLGVMPSTVCVTVCVPQGLGCVTVCACDCV